MVMPEMDKLKMEASDGYARDEGQTMELGTDYGKNEGPDNTNLKLIFPVGENIASVPLGENTSPAPVCQDTAMVDVIRDN
ncbi:hypothetical protein Btru_013155 [Bulinus truncatus]|nr:hypothetical protein Btru_013155 [Bulinus truncatus]